MQNLQGNCRRYNQAVPGRRRSFSPFLAQLLYLSKRERPEIKLSVSFLCIILRGLETYDYKKILRVTKYIQGIIGLPLILSIKNSGT